MARQHLGQHFLADVDWREQIARAIGVSPHSEMASATRVLEESQACWIEIGPGHGEMTEYLAGSGLPVYAIEVDPVMVPSLARVTRKFPNVEVVQADILQSDLRAISGGRRMKIYGNLPYYITSPILHHLFEFAELIDEIHVVVQTEVAERLAAEPGKKDYGYLSVATQFFTRPEMVLEIPRSAFEPPPEVGSALVTMRLPGARATLELAGGGSEKAFLGFVKMCFSQKRKTLVNNLRGMAKPEEVREALAGLDLRLDARAEQIAIVDLAALYGGLRQAGDLPGGRLVRRDRRERKQG